MEVSKGSAWGLLVVGVAMRLVPVIRPDWFPPDGPDGSSGRALWLAIMGTIEAAIALVVLFKVTFLPFLWRVATFRPKAAKARIEAAAAEPVPAAPPIKEKAAETEAAWGTAERPDEGVAA